MCLSFYVWLIPLSTVPSRSTRVAARGEISFILSFFLFQRLNNIPLYLIHSPVDEDLRCLHTLAVVHSSIKTGEHKYLSEILMSIPLDVHPEVELLGYMMVLFLIFLRDLHPVLHRGCFSLRSHQWCPRAPFSSRPCQHVSLSLKITDSHPNLCGRPYGIVGLICISVMISGVEHFFIHLFVTCVISLEKCLCEPFAQFLIGVFLLFAIKLGKKKK